MLQKLFFLAAPLLLVGFGAVLDHTVTAVHQEGTEQDEQPVAAFAAIDAAPLQDFAQDPALLLRAAVALAKTSHYADAIQLLQLLPAGSSESRIAARMEQEWINAIASRGKNQIGAGKVAQGVAILRAIPPEQRSLEVSGLIARNAAPKPAGR